LTLDAKRPVAVVTGASAGIGRATAVQLVGLGWQVIGVGRDPGRTEEAAVVIADAARDGGGITMLRGDFSLMAEVSRTAEDIARHTSRIDLLINNAGGVRDRQILTEEGSEATFATNHLAPFLLTRRLLPLLRGTAAARPPGSVRVIAVSSHAHRRVAGLDWEDLQGLGTVHCVTAYCRAKLANLLFTRELARREGAFGIVAQAMHPGVVDSNFAAHADAAMQAHMAQADTVRPEEPARTLVWLGTAPEGGTGAGRYFHREQEETPSDAALDEASAARLWKESEQILGKLGFH
jgi:NAD(P)-dependent dehydrogenase (short-subunit alcohol dehydrogenase family)